MIKPSRGSLTGATKILAAVFVAAFIEKRGWG
jgi:hypothetical protein